MTEFFVSGELPL